MTCGIPPAACSSVMTYFPEGFKSQRTGTRGRIFSKSSIVSGTRAACAIARRCRTAFVEPPVAITTAMAFSNAFRVRIWLGRIWRRMASVSARADSAVLSSFSDSPAVIVEEYGRLMPMASMAEDIVFAVYMPPQEPTPGQEWRSISRSSASPIRPALYSPTASKALTTVRFLP